MLEKPTRMRRLAAIFAADVVGYTRLMANDEGATLSTLDEFRGLMGGQVVAHGGRVVDAVGDNLLAEFPSAVDALRCAFETQRRLAQENESLAPARQMHFRIGINVGDILADGERIVGDGVNIAARVESTALPGGVALSGTAFDQVEGKLPLRAVEKEQQVLKNVAKPVRIFDVTMGGDDADSPPQGSTADWTGAGAAVSEPHAIAVLPFTNLSQDRDQEYFADGLAEDLITSLASLRVYPVIARNSSFTYKGMAVDVRQIGADLGARYVVTGSVRKAGSRVRVTAELVEASDARQIWSGRFDSQIEDIFELQDELTEKIAGAVAPALSRTEMRRAMRRPAHNVDAWDCIHRGMWHLSRLERDNSAKAETWAKRAIELQPESSAGYSLLSFSYLHQAIFQWSDVAQTTIANALRTAEQAVAKEGDNPLALTALGFALSYSGEDEHAVEVLERAVDLNPSSSMAAWALGAALGPAGRPDEAIPMIERAMRLSPQDPLRHEFLFAIASSHFIAGRYEDAMSFARKSLDLRPGQPGCHRLIAASRGYLGRLDEAAVVLSRLKSIKPDLSEEQLQSFLPKAIAARYVEGLRLAGWDG